MDMGGSTGPACKVRLSKSASCSASTDSGVDLYAVEVRNCPDLVKRSDGHSAGTRSTLASSRKLGMFAVKVCDSLLQQYLADICVGTFAVSVLGVFALAFAIEGVRRLVCPITPSFCVANAE